MKDYTGIKCPVCGKPFTETDDIVVCPECGAPYHRECYAQSGACIFTELHGTDKAWAPPVSEQPQTAAGQNGTDALNKRCPICGKQNAVNALFCDQCGQPLTGNPQNSGFPQNYGSQPGQSQGSGFPPFGGFPTGGFPMGGDPNQPGTPMQFIMDPMGGVNPAELIDDIPAGDVAKLVQTNTHYYMPTLMNLNKFHKNKFNFCAFLFTGGWLLYRKQYKLGGIITAIMTTLYIAYTYITVNFSQRIFYDLLTQIGVSADAATSLTYAQMMKITSLLGNLPPLQIFLFALPSLIWIVLLVIMIVVGFNGNKFYCKHCVDTIHKICSENPSTADYPIQLQSRGGVNTSLAICLLICYIIVMFLPSLI